MSNVPPLALACLLSLTGCADTGRFYGSGLESNHRAIIERNTLNYMLANPETDDSYDGQVREAAFMMVQGMGIEQALMILEVDGATCNDRSCIWADTDRETLAEVTFGIRMPGPPRTSVHFRKVTVESDLVTQLSDISVRHWSRGETVAN
ncbi:MAG: hypothetical protein WBB25_08730 [Sulfitobacter sp.]